MGETPETGQQPPTVEEPDLTAASTDESEQTGQPQQRSGDSSVDDGSTPPITPQTKSYP